MRNALSALLGGKKKGCMLFAPYSNHHLGRHDYKKVDGFALFPCKSKEDAFEIVGDLLETGHLERQTAGIILFGGENCVERITLKEIRTVLEASKKKGR